jgi:hypothetical protein
MVDSGGMVGNVGIGIWLVATARTQFIESVGFVVGLDQMQADNRNELSVRFLMLLCLSAKGAVARWLVLPISALLLALAWRLAIG